MSELNPYAPPQADLTPETAPSEKPLASVWIRLVAQIVDALITAAILLPLQWITGSFGRIQEAAAAGSYFAVESLLWVPVSIIIPLAINWNLLLLGQTIGKKLLKIRILRKDGTAIDRTRIITHRFLPVALIGNIPLIGGIIVIVDALLIFRSGRNTLHDDLADTKVVVA